jgi:hypothetical protein
MAWVKAKQTWRAVARRTTLASTQKREWSSIPVTTLHSVPSARKTPEMMSCCHSSIETSRSQRT